MAIPSLSGAIRGWTKKTTCLLVTKSVESAKVIQTATEIVLDMNLQPLQPEKVNRKPEDQRAWKWYSLLTKKISTVLKIDDVIIISGRRYRIESAQNWEDAGFRRYECTEDYQDVGPMYFISYDGNGSTSGTHPRVKTYYQQSAMIAVLGNTYTKTGYAFTGWNTTANGSGTDYESDDVITLTTNVTLYAQWAVIP